MPSGAKKRKAAKKKKGNEPSNHENQPPLSPVGDGEDSKHEDKDSDAGEGGQQIEGVDQRKASEEGGNSVRVEREFNIVDESTTKNGSPKNDELSSKPCEVCSSKSSSPTSNDSSDNESHYDAAKISSHIVIEKPTEESGDSPAIDSEKIPSPTEKARLVSFEGGPSLNRRAVEEDEHGKQTSVEDRALEVEKSDKVLDQNEYIEQESDKNLAVSYITAKPTGDIGVVSEPDLEVTQPYIAEPPRPIQTTSWKGCCGIFELLTGSAR